MHYFECYLLANLFQQLFIQLEEAGLMEEAGVVESEVVLRLTTFLIDKVASAIWSSCRCFTFETQNATV